MSGERLSSILEIVSFALVTTDLYGKDRLQKLREKFNFIAKNAKEKLSLTFTPVIFVLLSIILVGYFLFKGLISEILILEGYEKHPFFAWSFMLIVSILILYTFYKLGIPIIFHILFTVYFITEGLLLFLLKVLLKLFPIEGILLFIGTICFLISKMIVFPK